MAVVEIRCPACGEFDAVVKVDVGSYRCEECDESLGPGDVHDAG